MHFLHLVGAVSLLGKEGLDGRRDGVDECNQVAVVNVRHGVDAIGLVLLGAVMTQSDFVGIIQPCLVIWTVAGVENPLTKALAYGSEIVAVDVPLAIGEVVHQMGVRTNETVPYVKDILDLVCQNLTRQTQVLLVFRPEEYSLLQVLQVLRGERGTGNLSCPVGVTRDVVVVMSVLLMVELC